MKFARVYGDRYNQNPNNPKKAIHLVVFKWSGALFDLRRSPAAEKLAAFLNSWHYRNDNYVFAAHSHGSNVTNFALKELARLQRDKLQQKNDRIRETNNEKRNKSEHEPYVGVADLLVYFAPPCRQKFPTGDKNYDVLLGRPLFDKTNDRMANEPKSYNQLILFYSHKDEVVTKGVIDFYSFIGGMTSVVIAGVVSWCIGKSSSSEAQLTSCALGAVPVLYVVGSCTKAYGKKIRYAHKYHDIEPKNIWRKADSSYEVCGPKAQIQILVDGKRIGHSSTMLLKYQHLLWQTLEEKYPGHLACSARFTANINTKIKNGESHIQCYLDLIKQGKNDKGQLGVIRGGENGSSALVSAENIYLMKTLRYIKKKDEENQLCAYEQEELQLKRRLKDGLDQQEYNTKMKTLKDDNEEKLDRIKEFHRIDLLDNECRTVSRNQENEYKGLGHPKEYNRHGCSIL